MSGGRSGKMVNYINYRMRVTLSDTRMLVGKFLAFDKHMNLVLSDCEEFRRISGKGKGSDDREEKRALDLVLIRGENVVSLSVEGPPPLADARTVSSAAAGGAGRGAPAGRGVPAAALGAAAPGLAGPVAGVGGAGAAQMMPGRGAAVSGAPVLAGPPPGMGPPPGACPLVLSLCPLLRLNSRPFLAPLPLHTKLTSGGVC